MERPLTKTLLHWLRSICSDARRESYQSVQRVCLNSFSVEQCPAS